MILIKPSFEILRITADPLDLIEDAGRTCYKSDSGRNLASNHLFAEKILKLGHESVIEHASATVRIITSRRVSHQIVRHRLASFSQESQRYCDYKGQVQFIRPLWAGDIPLGNYNIEKIKESVYLKAAERLWLYGRLDNEDEYQMLRHLGLAKEDARDCLPNAAATELVMTMNFRNWRNFFNLRADRHADPEMQRIAYPLLAEFQRRVPVIFDDIDQPKVAANPEPLAAGLGPK